MYIQNYDCITAAGDSADQLMTALYEGRDCSKAIDSREDLKGRVGYIKDLREKSPGSTQEKLAGLFAQLWQNLTAKMAPALRAQLKHQRVALVFASTKGIIEDYIWQETSASVRHHEDPFEPVIKDFCQTHADISWQICCNISNACSSSHVACEYIDSLFQADRADFALLLAADLIGPFISKGFASLKILSSTRNRPFASGRDGLQLGDAAAMILFSRLAGDASLELSGVESHTEGTSITRPSFQGNGLVAAMNRLHARQALLPDLIIAHGTGTQFNDLAEDLALQQFLTTLDLTATPVTGSKWSIGHTLGASGCIDLIVACEVLRRKKAFVIKNTATPDATLKMNYLTADKNISELRDFRQIMVNSLGFGGVHASLVVGLVIGRLA